MEKQSFFLKEKRITCYLDNGPFIYRDSYVDDSEELFNLLKEEKIPFSLINISHLSWNKNLTPYPIKEELFKGESFLGKGDEYLSFITQELIPLIEKEIKPTYRILSGYSLGGLFSLYAGYKTNLFTKLSSSSGSLWYPSFVDFVRKNKMKEEVVEIKLSLGDKEDKTKNPLLKNVLKDTLAIVDILKEQKKEVSFTLNPGNHFKDNVKREALDLLYLLKSKVKI